MNSINIDVRLGDAIYTIVGASIIGKGKIENQDNFKIQYNENCIAIAVADGLGSAINSRLGSKKIVDITVDQLLKLEDLTDLGSIVHKLWISEFQEKTATYDTTIKFIKIENHSIIYGGIGDGWIAIYTNDEFLSLTSENIFSNQTDSILSFDLKNKFIINKYEINNKLSILISTDGFSEDMDKELGKELLINSANQINMDPFKFLNDLEETLRNWPVSTNRDDKTVLFIQKKGCKNEGYLCGKSYCW